MYALAIQAIAARALGHLFERLRLREPCPATTLGNLLLSVLLRDGAFVA